MRNFKFLSFALLITLCLTVQLFFPVRAQETEEAADSEQTEVIVQEETVTGDGEEKSDLAEDSDTESEPEEEDSFTQTASIPGYTVTAVYGKDAQIPEDAVLTVEEKEESLYQDLIEQEVLYDMEVQESRTLSISFIQDGVEIEPAKGSLVQIDITLDNPLNMECDEVGLIHMVDEETPVLIDDVRITSDFLSFETESFSDFVLYASSTRTTFNHIDIECDASFYYLVDNQYYYVVIDIKDHIGKVYKASLSDSGELSYDKSSYDAIDNVNFEIKSIIYTDSDGNEKGKVTTSGNWQTSNISGYDYEYRISGTFQRSYFYIVDFKITYEYNNQPVELEYVHTYSFWNNGDSGAPSGIDWPGGNLCTGQGNGNSGGSGYPGSSNTINDAARGLDIGISSDVLTTFFTQGDLDLVKVVSGTTSSTQTFSFQVYGPTDNAAVNATYWGYANGTPYESDTPVTISIKGAGTVHLGALPTGSYIISEVDIPAGYTPDGQYQQVIVSKEAGHINTATFTNAKSAGISLKKQVEGLTGATQSFNFTLQKKSGNNWVDVKTDISLSDGSVLGIPLDANTTYRLKENDPEIEDYICTATLTVDGNSVLADAEGWFEFTTNSSSGSMVEVICTNAYTPAKTSITISKEVTGNMGDRNKDFSFTLASNTVIDSDDESLTLSEDGKTAQFMLKNGESITVSGIQIGSELTLTETNAGGYTISVNGQQLDNNSYNWTVTYDDRVAIKVTNHLEKMIPEGFDSTSYLPFILLGIGAAGSLLLIRKRAKI